MRSNVSDILTKLAATAKDKRTAERLREAAAEARGKSVLSQMISKYAKLDDDDFDETEALEYDWDIDSGEGTLKRKYDGWEIVFSGKRLADFNRAWWDATSNSMLNALASQYDNQMERPYIDWSEELAYDRDPIDLLDHYSIEHD